MSETTCQHADIISLYDGGDYGEAVKTDWDWCRNCGAVKVRARNYTWDSPSLEASLAEVKEQRDEAVRQFAVEIERSTQAERDTEAAEQQLAEVKAESARLREALESVKAGLDDLGLVSLVAEAAIALAAVRDGGG